MCTPLVTCSVCGPMSSLDHTAWDCSSIDEQDDLESLFIRYPKQFVNLLAVAIVGDLNK